jgi:DNA helicase-2/ATP-dependent DNA helicase PcrA
MKLRPQQQTVADYTGGRMAVSAVPGSGKTQALAALVASLIGRGALTGDGEILVVTFTNSAVDNVKARIRRLLTEAKLPADAGSRVLTLHGLANTILRDRPDLAGRPADVAVAMRGHHFASPRTTTA